MNHLLKRMQVDNKSQSIYFETTELHSSISDVYPVPSALILKHKCSLQFSQSSSVACSFKPPKDNHSLEYGGVNKIQLCYIKFTFPLHTRGLLKEVTAIYFGEGFLFVLCWN